MGIYYTIACDFCKERLGNVCIKNKILNNDALHVIDFINEHMHDPVHQASIQYEECVCYDDCECVMSYKEIPYQGKQIVRSK